MKCNMVQIYFTKLTFMAYNISLLPLQTKKRRFLTLGNCEYSCIDRKYFHWKCAFSFSKTKHLWVCVHWIDTAWPCKKNINAENIVYLCFNILISERQWKLRELVPSFHSWDKENYSLLTEQKMPRLFFLSKICYDLTIARKCKSLQFRKSWPHCKYSESSSMRTTFVCRWIGRRRATW